MGGRLGQIRHEHRVPEDEGMPLFSGGKGESVIARQQGNPVFMVYGLFKSICRS